MDLDRRLALGVVVGIGTSLAAVVVFDIYQDVVPQGKSPWSALAENAVPLALALALPYAAWRLADRGYDRTTLASVARWTVTGTVTMLVVVGFQVFQGELKPRIIVFQTTVVGAAAGLLVGYTVGQLRTTRATVEDEKERWESLFDNGPNAVVDVRQEGGTLVVAATNDRFETLTATRDVDLDGRPLFDVVEEPTGTTPEELREQVRGQSVLTVETSHPTTEGKRHFQLTVVPYGDSRAFFIYQDVTDLVEAKAELAASNERLQQFAYVASHDLQEPLRMVSSYVDLLASEYEGKLDEEADEYIAYAVDGAERMDDMIDALLQYARVDTRGEEPDETDAQAVFEAVQADLELLVGDHDATVTAEDLPRVLADADQLWQLFQNLLKNAVEHSSTNPESQAHQDAVEHSSTNPRSDGHEDGIEDSDTDSLPAVRVTADERGDEVVISVTDNGPGIPEDRREEVFEIFEQGDDSDGTGIGLAVCRRIVERHDGDIWVESTPGEGTTVAFSLPKPPTGQSISAREGS